MAKSSAQGKERVQSAESRRFSGANELRLPSSESLLSAPELQLCLQWKETAAREQPRSSRSEHLLRRSEGLAFSRDD